jgi:hypothetical protein
MKFPALPLKAASIGHASKRPLTILTAIMAVGTLFLLAASLNNLEFRPGQSFVLPQQPEAPIANRFIGFPAFLFDLFLLLLGIAVLVSLVVLLRSPKDRRLLLKNVGQMLLLAAIMLLFSSLYKPEEESEVQTTPQARAPSPVSGLSEVVESSGTPPMATLAPPAVPGWVRFAVTLGIVLLAAALGYWVWRLVHKPKEELQEITRSALGDLLAGRNWEDVVIRCYADMSVTVSRRRGVWRHQAMTPREFAMRLEQLGLPAHSVGRLTRLFEQARYSAHQSTPNQVQEATDCLAEIMQAMEGR